MENPSENNRLPTFEVEKHSQYEWMQKHLSFSMLFPLAAPQGHNSTVRFLGNSPVIFRFVGNETQGSGKKKAPKGNSKRRNSLAFFLESTYGQLFTSAQRSLNLERFDILVRCSSHRHDIFIWKGKEKSVGLSLLTLANILSVSYFGCYCCKICKTWWYQQMSHFWRAAHVAYCPACSFLNAFQTPQWGFPHCLGLALFLSIMFFLLTAQRHLAFP